MRSITHFGTYGFMALLLAAQTGATAFGSDRTVVDAKKTGRSVKRDLKKTGRKITGKQSKWEDVKDSAHDAKDNTKDEVKHQAKKLK